MRRAANARPSPPSWPSLVAGFFGESLFGGKVLSPADVLCVSASFRDARRAATTSRRTGS